MPSLRTRLLLLVLFAFLPVFGLLFDNAIEQRQDAAHDAQAEALRLVHLASAQQKEVISNTRQILLAAAQFPSVRARGQERDCSRVLAELRRAYPYYTNLGVALPNGDIVCSAIPLKSRVNIADRRYFRAALRSREFSVGEFQVGRVTGKPAINLGHPILDRNNAVQAVVYAALDLSWIDQTLRAAQLPAGSALTVVDGKGTILARIPDAGKWIGKQSPAGSFVHTLLTQGGEGAFEAPGLDGDRRLFAYATLFKTGTDSAYIALEISKAVVTAAADRAFVRSISILLIVAVLAGGIAWIGNILFVARPLNALVDSAGRIGRGDLATRSGLPHTGKDIGRLAQSFDGMADLLQQRQQEIERANRTLHHVNRALKTLSAGNRTLLRSKEEPALLENMCRVTVETGGYRMAWVGYAEDDAEKSVRPVAHAGAGKDYLDTLDISWADTERGRGPVGTAVRTGRYVVVQNIADDPRMAPWRTEAVKHGFASVVALPLHVEGRAVGAFTIYAAEPDAFDDEALALLREMEQDLAFGIATLRDRERQREAERTIERMTSYDTLTGLPNDVSFRKQLAHSLIEAGEQNTSLALLQLDIERFREINESLGFDQGNLLIKEIGARLHAALGKAGRLARLRGDEFAALLPGAGTDRAYEIARRLQQALAEPITLAGVPLDVHANIGIVLFPDHGREVDDLLRRVDLAVQQARKSGSGYTLYAPDGEHDSPRRLALASELRRAIEKDELLLFLQPKVDIATRRVVGAEALVRWKHPVHGLIPPGEFITLAEHTGLIKPLTEWVLTAAVRQGHDWRKQGFALPIAVNLSARNLREAGLLGQIRGLHATWGTQTGHLEIEITESAIMDDPAHALEILRNLKDEGIPLFIDDFGTGYSSLSYLKKLPMDALKIDRSFVSDLGIDKDSEAIVRSTIDLAHDLGLKVVAEGVESEAVWHRLNALRCDQAQGYYISKPMPVELFPAWVTQYHAGIPTANS